MHLRKWWNFEKAFIFTQIINVLLPFIISWSIVYWKCIFSFSPLKFPFFVFIFDVDISWVRNFKHFVLSVYFSLLSPVSEGFLPPALFIVFIVKPSVILCLLVSSVTCPFFSGCIKIGCVLIVQLWWQLEFQLGLSPYLLYCDCSLVLFSELRGNSALVFIGIFPVSISNTSFPGANY